MPSSEDKSLYLRIADKYLDKIERREGKIVFRGIGKNATTTHWYARRRSDGRVEMRVPIPDTLIRLQTLLHEVAHVLNGDIDGNDLSNSSQEYNANAWALNVMEEHGITITKALLEESKKHVARVLKEDIKDGVEPDPLAVDFIGA